MSYEHANGSLTLASALASVAGAVAAGLAVVVVGCLASGAGAEVATFLVELDMVMMVVSMRMALDEVNWKIMIKRVDACM